LVLRAMRVEMWFDQARCVRATRGMVDPPANVQARALVGAERHGLVTRPPSGAVILPAEGDTAFVECQQGVWFEIATRWV